LWFIKTGRGMPVRSEGARFSSVPTLVFPQGKLRFSSRFA
jgi:hypothetical protein